MKASQQSVGKREMNDALSSIHHFNGNPSFGGRGRPKEGKYLGVYSSSIGSHISLRRRRRGIEHFLLVAQHSPESDISVTENSPSSGGPEKLLPMIIIGCALVLFSHSNNNSNNSSSGPHNLKPPVVRNLPVRDGLFGARPSATGDEMNGHHSATELPSARTAAGAAQSPKWQPGRSSIDGIETVPELAAALIRPSPTSS